MATTTNFGWETPDDTDLVKDGAAAMRTLGNSIDTSFVDLKGGTTNQVLAKNSNTDLDFKWVADATGIPATIIDAKGDLIAGTAADTAGRLAVGANGTVLTADSAETTGLKWATPASGGMTLISTTTLSGASTTITIPSGYVNFQMFIVNATASGTTSLNITVNSGTGCNYQGIRMDGASETKALTGAAGAGSLVTPVNLTNGTNVFNLEINNYEAASTHKLGRFYGNYTSTYTAMLDYMFRFNNTAAVTAVEIFPASGTWSSGTIKLYGVK